MKINTIIYFISFLISSSIPGSQQRAIKITYIANEGFLVESKGKQILIDALFNFKDGDYLNSPDSTNGKIQNRQKPFTNANLLLISHNHADHFNDSMVVNYLNKNPENLVLAPTNVTQAIIKHPNFSGSILQTVTLPEQLKFDTIINDVRIRSFHLQHDNRPQISNNGFLVEIDGIKIFHTGDNIGLDIDNYDKLKLQEESIDLAFLNYYGFWKNSIKRDFTKNKIYPKNIVLMHIPPNEFSAVKDSVNKISDFIDVTVFENSMDQKTFNY